MKFSITNLFTLVTIVALAISLFLVLYAKDPVVTLNSRDDYYSFKFRQELLKQSPPWPETNENPPLSVRGAIKIADEICQSLDTSSEPLGIGRWTFDSLCITHLNTGFRDIRTRNSRTKWCYIVNFQPFKKSNLPREAELATFMILLDGTVFVGERPWINAELKNDMLRKYGQHGG